MVLRLASIALVFVVAPLVAGAQVPARAPTRAGAPTSKPLTVTGVERHDGWFGFRFDVAEQRMVVLEVAANSPAERAGLRKGDMLLTIDGQTANPTTLAEKPPVPGEKLALTVRRGTEILNISMVATAPPTGTLMPARKPVAVMDTVERQARELRGEMALKATRAPGMPIAADSVKDLNRTPLSTKPLIIVDGVIISESLRDTLNVNARVDAAVAGEMYATLKRLTDGDSSIVDSRELYDRLERTVREVDAVGRAQRSNAISGAEFEQLNPGLADYFGGVGEGVFVLRVSGATPAFAAGLRAGDIVQSVNGQYVASIADLRNAVDGASGTITLRLIRKGAPASVVLRKE